MTDERPLTSVLVVEDDDAQRQTLCDILVQEGFAPVPCATAAEALEQAHSSRAAIAILDLRLPDMNGLDALGELLALLEGARVIIHTGYGSFESAREALNRGAFAYVEKVSDPQELVGHVHRAVEAQLAQALRDGEDNLRVLTEHVPDFVLQVHRNGRIAFVNRALPGHTIGEMRGRHLREWVRAGGADAIELALGRVFENALPQQCEVVVDGPDGARYWYSCRVGPIGSASAVERAIIIARDITEERQAQQIERVLLQLVRNALEATSKGGSVAVEIEDVALAETDFGSDPASARGPHVRISVRDDGCGIGREDLDRIFDPFFTTKPERGRGLGLTEVYGIVAEAGGHLSVESDPSSGSTFRVYLPTSSRRRRRKPTKPPSRGTNVVRRFRPAEPS